MLPNFFLFMSVYVRQYLIWFQSIELILYQWINIGLNIYKFQKLGNKITLVLFFPMLKFYQ